MAKYETKMLNDDIYPFHIQQEHRGWARSGYDRQIIDVKVRAVDGEAQVSIEIINAKGDRLYTRIGGLSLSPDEARLLAIELLKASE